MVTSCVLKLALSIRCIFTRTTSGSIFQGTVIGILNGAKRYFLEFPGPMGSTYLVGRK